MLSITCVDLATTHVLSQCSCCCCVHSSYTFVLPLCTDCAVCAPNYSKSIGKQCTKCKKATNTAIYTALAAVVVLCALAVWLALTQLLGIGDGHDAVSAAHATSSMNIMNKFAALPWDKLRIPIVAFQILTQYISITGFTLPDTYRDFLKWIDILNLDFSWVMSFGCMVTIKFYQKLLLVTLTPFIVVVFLACTYTVLLRREQVQAVSTSARIMVPARTARLEKALAKHYLAFLATTFLIYSTVSTAVFQTFACDVVDIAAPNISYLRADYSIQCGTAKHRAFKVYAGIMVIIYPLGIPALYAWLLWINKHKLTIMHESPMRMLSRHRDVSLRPTRFLWKTYTPNMYYWEVVECMRRLLLTGAIVFIAPGTSAQAAIACVLAVISMAVALYCHPHADRLDANIYTTGAMIVFLSMFLSLAINSDISTEDHQSQKAFAIVLVILNIALLSAAFVQIVFVGRRAWYGRQTSVLGLGRLQRSSSSRIHAIASPTATDEEQPIEQQQQQQQNQLETT
jgi:hypothetical protein